MGRRMFTGAAIFDGESLGAGALLVEAGRVVAILPEGARAEGADETELSGGILAPGFVDLQVNGGDGIMFNDAPTPETLARIAEAHAGLGALNILPTLITDTSAQTQAALAAVETALSRGVPGIIGLHLEGPHLSLARKGAHDPDLIRPMAAGDLEFLVGAVRRIRRLMVTVAPESVSDAQIAALAKAGVVVSLGHSDASYDRCRAAMKAGARVVTHLHNAMSQLGNREPGLVGAALESGALDAGLIADGIHVHPATIAAALRAKRGPGEVFLVSDAMATAGSSIRSFKLNGREIRRENGRLTLADGTLAGADLDLATAVRVLCDKVGIARDRALAMATRIPARVIGLGESCGRLAEGRPADFVHLSDGLQLIGIWRGGESVEPGLI